MDIPTSLLPGQYFANTEYASETGQNIGLSIDSPNFSVFALHRRSSRGESLQTGLLLNLEHRHTISKASKMKKSHIKSAKQNTQTEKPPNFPDLAAQTIIAAKTLKLSSSTSLDTPNIGHNFQNFYRVQLASLFSQNLTKGPSQSGWYLPHIQQSQNANLYAGHATERWEELLRYDRAVKQFYFQAQWKHLQPPMWAKQSTSQNTRHKTRLELRTEQSSSVSPLDYWGIQQRYHFQFELPLYDKTSLSTGLVKTLTKSLILRNYFFASYTDANWVDAQRRLTSSRQAQFYRRRLLFQNQMGWYLQQKVPDVSTTYDHILRLKASAKIARFLEPQMLSYFDFGLEYHFLRSKTKRLKQTWYLTLKADFAQQQPTSSQLEQQLFQTGPILWRRKLSLGIGWKQNPPTRIPQKSETAGQRQKTGKLATRLGWKLAIQSRESDLSAMFGTLRIGPERKNLQGSLDIDLFLQFWRYGRYFGRTTTLRWWKLFALQLKLGVTLSFAEAPKQRNKIINRLNLHAQLQARLQLAKSWSFQLGFQLEDWKFDSPGDPFLEPATPARFSMVLLLRYELQQSHKKQKSKEINPPEKNIPSKIFNEEPVESFEESFQNIFNEQSDQNKET